MLLLLLQGISYSAEVLTKDAVLARARTEITRLEQVYWSPTLGIWLDEPGDDLRGAYEGRRRPPWWPSANAVEVLLDFMKASGTSDYEATLATLYRLQKDHHGRTEQVVAELKRREQWSERDERSWQRQLQRAAAAKAARAAAAERGEAKQTDGGHYSDFQNEYLDDSGWWALAWLKMYDRTQEEQYLTTAKTIHAHMAKNWRPDKGGGVLWCEDEDKQRPNAITNNLFLILSARLFDRTRETAYRDWAEKTVDWVRKTELFDGTAIVDGPGHKGDYWSYNQGTYIGGLVALHEATGNDAYLEEAIQITDSVLTNSGLATADGCLIEKLGTGGDAGLFKGIFVRYLAQLRDHLVRSQREPALIEKLNRCIRATAASVLQHGVGEDGLFTAEWHEGAVNRKTDFGTHVSGIAALVAAVQAE